VGSNTAIAWAHDTFNPWWGCVEAGTECDNCYARTFSHRLRLELWGKDAPRRFFGDEHWAAPERWNRQAQRAGVRRRVFCASMADVMEDRRELDAPRERLWDLIERTPWLDWLLLTKRPIGFRDLVPGHWRWTGHGCGWPPNAWAGTTCGSPAGLARVKALMVWAHPASIRFVSVEPQVASLELFPETCPACGHAEVNHAPEGRTVGCQGDGTELCSCRKLRAEPHHDGSGLYPIAWHGINWVIQGGESGPHARAFDVAWARRMRDQCKAAGAAYFLKQLGRLAYDSDTAKPTGRFRTHPQAGHRQYEVTARKLRLADGAGADPSEWPEDLRVQQFPVPRA
jgi:protein gp37